MCQGERIRKSFDYNWQFYRGEVKNIKDIGENNEGWIDINLPYDWSIEGPFSESNSTGGDGAYLPAGIGWYRKRFFIEDAHKNGRVWVEFDGIYMNSDIWINGVHLGNEPYGYTSFYCDITPYLNHKKNEIIVKVDNSKQPNSRWYTGSGIYRHTWISYLDNLHIGHWGVAADVVNIMKDKAELNIMATVVNEYNEKVYAEIENTVLDAHDKVAAVDKTQCLLAAGEKSEVGMKLQINRPCRWSVDNPYLYRSVTVVRYKNRIVDTHVTNIGIRKVEFDADNGFLINDERVKLNGVCLHHDGGCVGAAVPERVLQRRLELLKGMGCNAIRMSHNPPSSEMLDLCDSMGLFVMNEAFDEWIISKNKSGINHYGYHEYFEEHAEDNLTSILHRDRNHPCIVLWSVGNEIPEQTKPEGPDILKKLIDICHKEDPSRMVTLACDNIKSEPYEATEEFLSALDVVGYNYVARWRLRTETFYSEDYHRFPKRRIIGSENPSIGGVRGDYSIDKENTKWWWGPYNTNMINAEQLWKFTKAHDYVAGDFMWTGIDYLGEAKWPDKNSSCGVIDMCGFPKDAYYFYKSQWTKEPMVHVFPHWNWEGSEGKVIPVLCYTNCDSAELFLNGKSFGVKSYEFPRQGMSKEYGHFERPYIHVTTSDLHLCWDVPYEPGVIKVVGRNGSDIVCEEEIVTTGAPAKIELIPDRNLIAADGRDVCNITIKIMDDKGNAVPVANNLINLKIEGNGRLIGMDNGKPDSHESFKVNYRNAFNGLALAVIQSTFIEGRILVTAASEGLESKSIVIETKLLPEGRSI